MEPRCTLRRATRTDAEALGRIYAPYVKNTTVTFEYDPPTAEEFAARIADVCGEYPYLVCERDGEPLGYAYGHRLFARAAYAWNAELSVYVREDCRGMGIGPALCRAVIALLQMQGVLCVYGVIAAPNEASERLHRALGFQKCAEFANAGFKHGSWHNTLWYQKTLGAPAVPPAPIVPFAQLPQEAVEAVLEGEAR